MSERIEQFSAIDAVERNANESAPAMPISRREALKQLGALAPAAMLVARFGSAADEIIVAGKPVEIAVWSLSAQTVRVIVSPLDNGRAAPVAATGALVTPTLGTKATAATRASQLRRVRAGNLNVRYTESPPTIHIELLDGTVVQTITLDATAPRISFLLGSGPLLGFGEGGAQFDRKGVVDPMRNGQVSNNVYRLSTHGTRAPVQWLVSPDGWAMFVHQPYGSFDLTGKVGVITPAPWTLCPLRMSEKAPGSFHSLLFSVRTFSQYGDTVTITSARRTHARSSLGKRWR